MKKGNPSDRAACARFAKDQRARFRAGLVAGSFTRDEWNRQVFIATRNRLARMTAARRRAPILDVLSQPVDATHCSPRFTFEKLRLACTGLTQ